VLQMNHKGNFRSVSLVGIFGLLLPVVVHAQFTAFTISTIAGNGIGGFNGDGRAGTNAALNGPNAVLYDSAHNILYIADTNNERVRTLSGGKVNTIAGNGVREFAGDGQSATVASFDTPYALALDSSGNLYISDLGNAVVRMVNTSGTISTVAGSYSLGAGYSGDGGAATSAQLNKPAGLALDASGNLYIADSGNNVIRIVTKADGNINTFAGINSKPGYAGDGGQALNAKLSVPYGLAFDAAGNLYFSDSGNHCIRKVATNGIITTVAGTGTKAGYSGDGGLATRALLNRPFGIAVVGSAIYIADRQNSVIRVVTPDGKIQTVAGNGSYGYSGDGGAATSGQLSAPSGVAVDSSGNVYIADPDNNLIRQLTPSAPTIDHVISASAFGAFNAVAPGSWIEIYGGANLARDDRMWTGSDFSGSTAPTGLDGTSVTIGGQAAFMYYISGGQVNVQVPTNVSTGTQSLVLKSPSGTSASYSLAVNATEPGLLAPASFQIGGTQYVVATFPDGAFVLPPGAIAGVNSRRAKPNDVITLWGVGFGSVSPAVSAGQIAAGQTALVASPTISFAGTAAVSNYAGLSPGSVGLYQFNLIVPSVAASDAVPVTFSLNGVAGTQTLFTAIAAQ